MGRSRIIDRNDILDAAQRVVARDGTARLTLEAVVEEVGASKAGVLHDHRSKRVLIEALVERALRLDHAHRGAATRALGPVPSPAVRGRIAAARERPTDEGWAVALQPCAALAQDAGLRRPMQDNQREVVAAILRDAASPRGALLAYLALEGLKLLEVLDFHAWPELERARLLREIDWLVGQAPKSGADR